MLLGFKINCLPNAETKTKNLRYFDHRSFELHQNQDREMNKTVQYLNIKQATNKTDMGLNDS